MAERRKAIVTGAASGLGRAIAVELAAQNWHIALADVNPAGSQETLDLVRKAGGDGQVEQLDVTREEAWRELRDKLKGTWPRLDLLVNNAGVGVAGEVGQLPLEDWHWIVNINLFGAIYGCHTLLGWLKENPNGAHIANIASLAAVASAPGMAPYNVTKAGMVSFSETLYGELKPHRIGVTVVCPFFFRTNILRDGRFQNAGQRKLAEGLMGTTKATAESVARHVVRAINRNELYVFTPALAGFYWRLKRLMPLSFLSMVARRQEKEALRAGARGT